MQQFIVSTHWTDAAGRRNTLVEHVAAQHIDAACEILECRVLAEEPYVLDLWSEATGDIHPPTS